MTNTDAQKEADATWKVVGEMLAIATGATFTSSVYFAHALRQAVRAEVAAARTTNEE